MTFVSNADGSLVVSITCIASFFSIDDHSIIYISSSILFMIYSFIHAISIVYLYLYMIL